MTGQRLCFHFHVELLTSSKVEKMASKATPCTLICQCHIVEIEPFLRYSCTLILLGRVFSVNSSQMANDNSCTKLESA